MNNRELVIAGMEIMQSFCIAMQKASGALDIDLKELSALELLEMLSTNNIRFVYEGDN